MPTFNRRLVTPGGHLTCPECKRPALREKTQYGRRDACYQCGLWSWKGKPLVDAETHAARKAAHEAFDTLWKGPTSIMKRKKAYRLLALELELPGAECHMALMDKKTALRVPEATLRIRERINLPTGE